MIQYIFNRNDATKQHKGKKINNVTDHGQNIVRNTIIRIVDKGYKTAGYTPTKA